MRKLLSGDRVVGGINLFLLLLVCLIMLYPFLYTLSASISDPSAVTRGEVVLFPVGFNINAYKLVMSSSIFFRAYANTFFYSAISAVLSATLLLLTAYPLANRKLAGRKIILTYLTITMFFSGGMIPTYLLIKSMGMLDTIWAVVLPGALSMWNIILCRTFVQGIPDSLKESAMIDGAGDWRILLRIILPLSKAMLAVMMLYAVVGQWNSYFGPMLYLTDEKKYPLQLVLRRFLQDDSLLHYASSSLNSQAFIADNSQAPVSLSVSSATIMLTVLPIVCIYPFLQKYFTQGLMLGSIKG